MMTECLTVLTLVVLSAACFYRPDIAPHSLLSDAPAHEASGSYMWGEPLVTPNNIIDISVRGIEERDNSGHLLWTSNIDKYLPAGLVSDGRVVVCAEKSIYALNLTDGGRRWSTKIRGNASLMHPQIRNGRIYLGTDNHLIYCVDSKTGDVLWVRDLRDGSELKEVVRGLSFSGNDLIVATEKWIDDKGSNVSGRLFRLSSTDGRIQWTYDTQHEDDHPSRAGLSSDPLVIQDRIYVSDALGGGLRAFAASNGSLVWKSHIYAASTNDLTTPVMVDGNLVIGSADGTLRKFNPVSGKLIASNELGASVIDLKTCGESLIAASWGMAIRLEGASLRQGQINGKLTLRISSRLANDPYSGTVIAFDADKLVRIKCSAI